jgi:acetyl-CoA synthetase
MNLELPAIYNAAMTFVDENIARGHNNKVAIYYQDRTFTYQELFENVNRTGNALKSLGVEIEHRVLLVLPDSPEFAFSFFGAIKIGAVPIAANPWTSANDYLYLLNDSRARAVIVDELALSQIEKIRDQSRFLKHVIVVGKGRGSTHSYAELIANCASQLEPEPTSKDDVCFWSYTSGSTGKPKGVLHTTAGYLLGTMMTSKWVFDLKDDDTYWCTADIGWVTGHSYIIYGLLSNGATTLMYEGAPNWPDEGRFWQIVEKYRVNIFYTAPTAIRSFVRWGEQWPNKYDLSSLRLLGTVGEPINPEAWMWYHRVIGQERCPIVDTWWQTETGAIMISPLPGVTATKPGSCTKPLPGIIPEIRTVIRQATRKNSG